MKAASVQSAWTRRPVRGPAEERTSPMDPTEMLALARRSLMSTTERMADLIAAAPDSGVHAHRCEWSLREVAAHLITGPRCSPTWPMGFPGPADQARPGLRQGLLRTPHRRPLRGRPVRSCPASSSTALRASSTPPSTGPATTRSSSRLDCLTRSSAWWGSSSARSLLHGYDMATALGRPWPIEVRRRLPGPGRLHAAVGRTGRRSGAHPGADSRHRDRTARR